MRSLLLSFLTLTLMTTPTIGAYSISVNTWVKDTLTFRLPTSVNGASWSTTDGYCTSIFDDSTHRLLWRTGVAESGTATCRLNPGYYSNTLLAWSANTDTARAIDVFNWGGGSGGSGCLLPPFSTDTTPSPRHTYDGLTYCKSNHSVYLMAGANWKLTSDTTRSTLDARNMLKLDDSSTWRLSLSDGKWHRIHGSIRQFWNGYAASPYESHLRAWPEGNKLLYTNDGGNYHAEMDLTTEKWTNISSNTLKAPFSLYNARSCWDRKRQLWVFRNDTNVCTYNPTTRTYKKLPSCKVSGSQAIAYDSRRDVYVAVGLTASSVRYFRYSDSTWMAPVVNQNLALTSGYLAYDSLNDLHLLVYQQTTYRFRLDTNGATTATEKGDAALQPSPTVLSVRAQPNPFNPSTTFYLSGHSKEAAQLTIVNMQGQMLYQTTFAGNRLHWHRGTIPSGCYSVHIQQGTHRVTERIVLLK